MHGKIPSSNDRPDVLVLTARSGLLNFSLSEMWRYRELLYFIIWRELKVRYKQALIGAGWAIIQPVLAMLIFTIVFSYFGRMPSDGLPYALFSYCALLPWIYFSEALRRGSIGLIDDAELIRKIYFPRLILPLAMVLAPLVDFALSFSVLVVLFLWYGVLPSWPIIFVPAFVILVVILALATSLWLGPLNIRFRDVKHAMPFLVQIWMYSSPIIYPVSMIPEEWRLLYSLNPMVGVIEGFRWALLGTASPDFSAMGLSVLFAAGFLVTGLVYFNHSERFFADVI